MSVQSITGLGPLAGAFRHDFSPVWKVVMQQKNITNYFKPILFYKSIYIIFNLVDMLIHTRIFILCDCSKDTQF